MSDNNSNNKEEKDENTQSVGEKEIVSIPVTKNSKSYKKRNCSMIDIKDINDSDDTSREVEYPADEITNDIPKFDFNLHSVQDSDSKENRHIKSKETDRSNQVATETEEIVENFKPIHISMAYSIYNSLFSSILYIVFIVILLEICYIIFFSYFLGVFVLKGKKNIIANEKDYLNTVSLMESILEIEKKRLLIKKLNQYALIADI